MDFQTNGDWHSSRPLALAHSTLVDVAPPQMAEIAADAGFAQIEARVLRQMPGDGTFPLSAILNRLPADVPLSVEVPNPVLIREIGPREYARRAYRTAAAVVGHALLAERP